MPYVESGGLAYFKPGVYVKPGIYGRHQILQGALAKCSVSTKSLFFSGEEKMLALFFRPIVATVDLEQF